MKNKDTVKKLLLRIKPYMPLVLLSLILAFITVASTLYVPIVIGQTIDCIAYKSVDFKTLISLLTKVVLVSLFTIF